MLSTPISQHIYVTGRIIKRAQGKNKFYYSITISSKGINNTFEIFFKKPFADAPIGTYVTVSAYPYQGSFSILSLYPCPPLQSDINNIEIYGYPTLIEEESCVLLTELGKVFCCFPNKSNIYQGIKALEGEKLRVWGELQNNYFFIKGGSLA